MRMKLGITLMLACIFCFGSIIFAETLTTSTSTLPTVTKHAARRHVRRSRRHHRRHYQASKRVRTSRAGRTTNPTP